MEVCPVIIGVPDGGTEILGSVDPSTLITGSDSPAVEIYPVSEDFCNPSSELVIIYNGAAIFDGTFKFG